MEQLWLSVTLALLVKKNNVLSIFDFDKTLIRGDSFRLFGVFCSKKISEKMFVLFLALCNKSGLITNEKYKEWVLRIVWLTKDEKQRELFLQELYFDFRKLENPDVVNLLKTHIELGDRVIVLSASPLFYLEPYVQLWSKEIEVYGTQIQFLNGRVVLQNLHRARKAQCARAIINQTEPSSVWVYTDHISDLPIIQLADRVRLVKPSAALCTKLNKLNIEFEIVGSRQHKRFQVQGSGSVVLKPNPSQVGQIIDISKAGLAFRYNAKQEHKRVSYEMDIFSSANGFYLKNIPFKSISDIEVDKEFSTGHTRTRRRGVQFSELKQNQIFQLEYFIRNYTVCML